MSGTTAARVLTYVVGVALMIASGGCQSRSDAPEPKKSLEGPALSLQLLAEAAEAGDWTDARLYVDVNSVGLAFARKTLQRARGENATETPSAVAGSHGEGFQASAMEEAFTERFASAVKAGVESGAVVAEGTLMATILQGGLGDAEYLNDDEALVRVTVSVADGSEEAVNLRMERVGDRWVLIAVEETSDLYGVFF